jgi:hypothetical protein
MVFRQEELPEIFEKILEKILSIIEENGGTITTEEFKTIFYGSPKKTLKLNDNDIINMMRWLKNSEYIDITRGNQYKESQLVLRS